MSELCNFAFISGLLVLQSRIPAFKKETISELKSLFVVLEMIFDDLNKNNTPVINGLIVLKFHMLHGRL